MEDRIDFSPSLKHRLKHLCGGCFKQGLNPNQHHPLHHQFDDSSTPHHHHHHHHNHNQSNGNNNNNNNIGKPRLMRSSSSGVGSARSNRPDEVFHIKDKCRNFISRMGTPRGHHHHRKSYSTDFRYDPLSYALNFDEGGADDHICVDELPLRNFSARLPPSPTPQPPPPLTPQPPPPSLSPLPRQHRHISEGAMPQLPPSPQPSSSNVREITAYS